MRREKVRPPRLNQRSLVAASSRPCSKGRMSAPAGGAAQSGRTRRASSSAERAQPGVSNLKHCECGVPCASRKQPEQTLASVPLITACGCVGRRESRRLALLSSSSKSTFRGFSPSHSALVQDGRRRPTGQLDTSPRSPRPECSLNSRAPAAGPRPTPVSADGSLAATRRRPRPARSQGAR